MKLETEIEIASRLLAPLMEPRMTPAELADAVELATDATRLLLQHYDVPPSA